MRGFFGMGVEGVTKPFNLGNLIRSSHAFGASFFFMLETAYSAKASDTSFAENSMPLYSYNTVDEMQLPRGCKLVGIELTDDAIDLPSFCHPRAAAYILGSERGSLSEGVLERCDHVIKIPTRFCVNVGIAGAIVMYDRMTHLGRWPARPLTPDGRIEPLPPHVQGPQLLRGR